tara:strand:- start:896 stop:1444 length:549 start_codon:yes stop_codon:yes gene_type:complete
MLDGDCIHMVKNTADIKDWEIVFNSLLESESKTIFLTPDDWSDILLKVSDELWEEYGEDDAGLNAPGEFYDIAKSFQLGQLFLDYPNSMHGDGCTVSLYQLPTGICVAVRFASFEIAEPNSILLGSELSIDQVLDCSRDLLFECGEIDEYQNLDESPDLDPDTRVAYSGELEVRSQWGCIFE